MGRSQSTPAGLASGFPRPTQRGFNQHAFYGTVPPAIPRSTSEGGLAIPDQGVEPLSGDDEQVAPLPNDPATRPVLELFDHTLGDGTTLVPRPSEVADFLCQPVPQGHKVQCRIVRHRDGMDKMAPGYEVFLEFGQQRFFIMSARKLKKRNGSTYGIYLAPLDQIQKSSALAKVRSNFLGTAFTITAPVRDAPRPRDGAVKPREELAAVLYEPNILGFKGPRKMTILLPTMTKSGERERIIPTQESETLLGRMKTGNDPKLLVLHTRHRNGTKGKGRALHGRNRQAPRLLVLHNKAPQWNEDTHSYVLNFNGRVTVASVKNFQIVHDNDIGYIIMQFGRTEDGTFAMDCQYPVSPLQCLGMCLTSFDAKLACE
ncbi:hypothetical protein AMAG_08979 [Allomyces macrogynus ATCC 38327]|uniref:Tubby C-terminal domain-containing protein n=1 Tax=Allomyces macrogynus (strain ATCC 38327) TaxID=578462 RepID=A0A0L0SNE3_ALLM3|nr:hypothetical protein AMAG_08979 [Allomyces macrogynus ATCC 38327]|eukprot:KNE63920.1 hypothetical protein AMAG_08979 [Allomyces macrogynus ATCC 38327]